MGLMDKFKNLFTEEVEEEVKPIKKEVRHVEIPSAKRETKVEEPEQKVPEVATPKEEKFVFPVYFDDKDFDDLEKPKKEEKPVKKELPKVEAYQGAKVQKVERRFEASPIISPVYGILDKNYKKEDISARKEQPTDYTRKPKAVTVDDIRNKAFGTLEDDLEDTLFGNKSILFRDEEEVNEEPEESLNTGLDIFEELERTETQEKEEMTSFEEEELPEEPEMESIENKQEEVELAPIDEDMDEDTVLLAKQLEEQKKKLEQINEYINENTTEKVEEPKSRHAKEDTSEEAEKDLTESELLSLVDAMYEKRDDE